MAEPNALLIIAHTPVTDIVGYLLAFTHQTFLANGPVTWIEEVMVAEEVRRRGIGHNLMVAAENWSASKGAAYVAVATRRASDFYLALGYTGSAAYFRKLVRAREQTTLEQFAPSPQGQLKLTQPSPRLSRSNRCWRMAENGAEVSDPRRPICRPIRQVDGNLPEIELQVVLDASSLEAVNGQKQFAGKVYFFKGDQYVRYDWATDRTDPGYPKSIAANWLPQVCSATVRVVSQPTSV